MRAAAATSWAALAALVAFLALPVVAVLSYASPADALGALGSGEVADALRVSAITGVAASVVTLAVGTPAAHLLATRRFRGRAAVLTLIELPLVLPPAVAGVGLLAAFGTTGLAGADLGALGVQVPFTRLAVVIAIVFVSAPLYLRHAVTAFEGVPVEAVETARTLGAGPAAVARRVVLPLAAPGLLAGWALAFARGIGEFGATLVFAGSLRGETRTLPLAVYAELGRDMEAAMAIGALLVVASAAVLAAAKAAPALAGRRGRRASSVRHRPGTLERLRQGHACAAGQPAGQWRGGARARVGGDAGELERQGHLVVVGRRDAQAGGEGLQPFAVGHGSPHVSARASETGMIP